MNSPINPVSIYLAESLHAALGAGTTDPATAGGGLAFFLLGLITGVVAALAAFFVYLHMTRARRSLSHVDGREGFEDDFEEPADPHSHPQQRMPWERPDDWWRNDS